MVTHRTKMKHRKLIWILPGLVLMTLLGGCYYDVEEELYGLLPCDTSNVTYSGTIAPMMASQCLGCHAGANASANINLDGHANMLIYVNNGSLSGVVNHQAGFSPMPKNTPKMSQCDLDKIRIWIDAGSPDN